MFGGRTAEEGSPGAGGAGRSPAPVDAVAVGSQPPRPARTWIGLEGWIPILQELGIGARAAAKVVRQAIHNGTTLQVELVAASLVREADLYHAIARHFDLTFEAAVDAERLTIGGSEAVSLLRSGSRIRNLRYVEPSGGTSVLIVPDRIHLGEMRVWSRAWPSSEVRLKVISPGQYRSVLAERARDDLVAAARDGLFVRAPHMSSREVFNGWQGMIVGALLVAIPAAILLAPLTTLLVMQASACLFFLGCVGLRIAALADHRPLPLPPPMTFDPTTVPAYTVLVALRDEAEIVPDLLVALGRLEWPRAKLQVRLVCESDDHETIDAIRSHGLRSWTELIEVPRGMPRTKPNALAYALPQTSGAFVALYDAEDRPHPLQLVEAWRRFEAEGSDLACLQAPLDIDNAEAGLLPRLFAAEYAGLFRGLLPWLARRSLVLPLGGTSNHFRSIM